MHISKERLEEFKDICWNEFGVGLSDAEAHERASAVLRIIEAVYFKEPSTHSYANHPPSSLGTISSMKEDSAGIIPIHAASKEILVVQHLAGHWGFPKGHLEGRETPREAALRELQEEVGITEVRIQGEPVIETYSFEKEGHQVEKKVLYFVGYMDSQAVTLNQDELKGYAWLPYAEATDRLTFSKKTLASVML